MFSGFKSVWIRFRSWRTADTVRISVNRAKASSRALTCNTRQELPSKALNVGVGEGNEAVALEKVEKTEIQQIRDDTDMATVVKAVPEVYTPISVVCIMVPQRL